MPTATAKTITVATIDAYGFDESQAGFYRNERTGRIVWMERIRHFRDGTGRIEASFRGTRDRKPFGRMFSKPIEDFFDNYEFVSKEA